MVCGCYSLLNPKRFNEIFDGDYFTSLTRYEIKDMIGSDLFVNDW